MNGLLSSPTDFEVTALVHAGSTSKIAQEGHAALKVVRGDFGDDPFLKSSLEGQDALVVCLDVNPATLELQNRLVDVAAVVGVKQVIPREFGSVRICPHNLSADFPKTNGLRKTGRYQSQDSRSLLPLPRESGCGKVYRERRLQEPCYQLDRCY